jgi:hypothetical protein
MTPRTVDVEGLGGGAPLAPLEESASKIVLPVGPATPELVRHNCSRWTQQNWDQVAGISWRYHRAFGRGLLVVPVEGYETSAEGLEPVFHLEGRRVCDLHLGPGEFEIVDDALRRYDPAKDVLLLFRFVTVAGLHLCFLKASHLPTPPEAHAQQQN